MAKRGRPKSKGLGDTIAKVTKATGIDRVVKAVVGDNCGCDERREKLNRLFPYVQNTLTMSPEQVATYEAIRPELYSGKAVSRSSIERLRILRNQILQRKDKSTSCGSCVRRWRDEFDKVYQNQCNAD